LNLYFVGGFGLSPVFFVRISVLGHVGKFDSADGSDYAYGGRVICRTQRGLEVGEVLGRAEPGDTRPPYDGTLLRRVTTEDDLLIARLERNKAEALHECESLLAQRRLPATLVDVEQLFDGQSIFFYFLGEVTPEIERITRELAEAYDSKVQFRQFTDAVARGCGPDCGTEDAAGCGIGCATCSIASACSSK
jgi:cell fate regulator YaaT (PSP1 superfamily)